MRFLGVRRLALVFLAACGGAPPTSTTPTTPTADAKEPHEQARIDAGEAEFGCVGWSPTKSSAACVIGQRGTMGTWMALYDTALGSMGVQVNDPVDNADALNKLLVEGAYLQFNHDATELAASTPLVLGNATVLLSSESTDSDVENTAPTFHTRVTATCGGKAFEVFDKREEGREYQASVRRAGDYAIVELNWSLAREGEYGSGMDAIVVHTKTCDHDTTDFNMPSTH